MGPSHHFHIDQRGHSITVTVRNEGSRTSEIEVLVDGKEISLQHVRGRGTTVVGGELPGEPPRPFRVLVHQPRLGSSVPRCTLEMDDTQQPIPERAGV
ncbi:hypothetical protein [Streptomyces palmae]|uniref:Uncharacterized protein n=1 Tax=Streptomyces palmae TaxID=1701085 RepID=A0A4Z0HHR6_9ACTN|nr:hypothetical protein [Streptomyces palmae]TGB18061.1 hypothetical protein E4099_02605 [Streptomyces palmae]